MTASWREVRLARNHALFREVDERINSASGYVVAEQPAPAHAYGLLPTML